MTSITFSLDVTGDLSGNVKSVTFEWPIAIF